MLISSITKRFRGMSAPMKTSFWFIVCSLIQKGITFLVTPIFTRVLTQEEYGVVSVYHSWLGILTIITTLQLSTGVLNKAMIKYSDDRDGYASSTFTLSSIFVILSFAIYIIFRKPLGTLIDLPFDIVVMLFLEIFFTNAMSMFTARERFEFRYKLAVIITFLANALATIVSLALILTIDADKAFLRIFGMTAVHIIFYSIAIFILYYRGRKIYVKEYWKYAVSYNLPLIPHYLSQQVLNSSDRIMINSITGSANAAIYSLAYQIAVVMDVLTSAIHATFAPWTFQKLEAGSYKAIGKRALQIEILIGGTCVLFSLFAPEFILILGGESYYDAVYIIPPVAMSVLFSMMYSFFANIEFYFEKTKFVMVASIVSAVSNIILNAIFIPLCGFVAAGYTTLACFIGYSIIHYLFMLRICKDQNLQNPYPAKAMWSVAFIFAIISICISFLYNFYLLRYLFIFILAIVIVIFLYKNKNSIFEK